MNTSNYQREFSREPSPEFLEVLRSFLAESHPSLLSQVSMEPSPQFYVEFPTHPDLLKSALLWFETLDLSFVPHRTCIEYKTMLGEAVDNVRDHAHQGISDTTLIPIIIYCFPKLLSLQIWDQGPGFDLMGHLKRQSNWTESTASRGRGLKIVEELSDCMGYLRGFPQGNCLIMVKTYSPADGLKAQ